MRRSLPFLLLLLLLPSTRVHAQVGSRCPVAITVADTLFLPGATPQQDSVRYHLQVSPSPDSLFWSPAALFADSTAAEQWLTLGCGDTVAVRATACFHNVNLFHWQQPGFVRTHTGYNYIDTPADGDLCRPRSITMNQNPQQLCPELTTANYQNAMIIRTDTLRCYGDSIPAFFNYDTNYRNETTTTLFQRLRQIPDDSAYAPFYIDTIVMWNPLRNHTFVLYTNYYRFLDNGDTLAALPSFGFAWTIDDTASILFSPGNRRRMCDTTFFYGNVELPRTGVSPSQSNMHTHYFNSTPRPHGIAVFRLYETPTPYYRTAPYVCINRLEMLGDCWASDSLLLAGPGMRLSGARHPIAFGLLVPRCPISWQGITFDPSWHRLLAQYNPRLCDTFRILRLSLLPDDTLRYSDTIVENALPWNFHGHIYQASGADTLLLPGLLPACDTLMYYQLHVIDNVFDTTYTYICPDQLPYTLATA